MPVRKIALFLLLLTAPAYGQITNNLTNVVTLVRESVGYREPVRRSQLSSSAGGLVWSSGSNNISVGGNITVPVAFLDNVTYTTVINVSTQVNVGTTTNYVAAVVYSTNYSYEVTIRERATNVLDVIGGWVFNNSYLNATNASYVSTPHFTDTKGGSLVATGAWDFTGATVTGLTAGVDVTITNGLLKNAGGLLTKSGDTVSLSTNGWSFGTAGAVTNETDPVFVAASNQFYLASNPSLYVTKAVTNGLATPAVTNGLLASWAANPSNSVLQAQITANSASISANTSAIALKADSNKTISVVINGATNSVLVGTGGTVNLGNLAAVTGSVDNAVNLGGQPAAYYASTNALMKLSVGIPPGAASVYGSTNDALLVGVSGSNANWDELQFSDTTQQRARFTIPAATTSRYKGGALTNAIYWRGTSTVGGVVWQVAMVGRTNSTLVDVAYQNQTIGSNTVSGVASNLNLTTIVLTPSNCPAGSVWLYELQRLPADANDTMVSNANVLAIGVQE